MSREKELAKNTFILFLGIFFTKVIQYFLLPLYTGKLSTDEFGTYELFTTIITLLLPVLYLQIEQGCFRFLIDNRKNKETTSKVISTSFYFVVLVNIIVIILFLLLNWFIHNQYKWLVLINLIFNSFFMLFSQISRGIGNNKSYSFSGFINAFITIIFNVLFLVALNMRVDGLLYGAAIGYLSCVCYLFFKLKLYDYISFKNISSIEFKRITKYSIPMIPNSISWWVFSSSDRFIVTAILGLSATGILSVAYKLSNIGIVIYNVFNMSLTESIALHINDSDVNEYFNKIFNSIGNFFVSFGSIIIAFLPIIFKVLINSNYNSAYNLIPIAIIATEFQVFVGMFGTVYVAKNSTKSIAITSVVSAIINVVVDLALIKFIGIYAAVISTFISYFVLFIYRLYDVNKKYLNTNCSKLLLINLIINIFVIMPLFYCDNLIIQICIALIAVISSIAVNKNIIIIFKNILKERRM